MVPAPFDRLPRRLWIAAGVLLIGGCAATGPVPGPTAAPGAAAPQATAPAPAAPQAATPAATAPQPAASTPPARTDPAAPRPFADVVRDATRTDGFVPVWRKDDKVWLEIAPERLGQPFLLTVNIASTVGERGLFASQMGPSWLAEFRRNGNTLQLIALNTTFRGGDDAAVQRAVRQGFSDSLLAYGALASAAQPQSQAVLVDATFLLGDLVGYATALERATRLSYAVDRANSQIESVRAEPTLTTLNLRLHFATPRIPAPPAVPPPSPALLPSPPGTPDPRSLFVGTVLNFAALPAQPMRPRAADPRVGHFTTSFTDFSIERSPTARVHWVNRWRLEKKDPTAALSEPVQPIVFWIDRNVPARYRGAVTAGVLEWNKAFERIGFRDAIVVRQQPDDAGFDTLDAAHASIRWVVGDGGAFARGPSHVDPRSGEILDADIAISDNFARGAWRFAVEEAGLSSSQRLAQLSDAWRTGGGAQACTYAVDATADLQLAFDLLEARGELAADGEQAEAIVQAYVRSTITHEVGHTLGLRHNFKASTSVPRDKLRDPVFAAERGLSGSVMDYNPFNLALAGEPRGVLVNPTLGAYDYWAIEYAYRPLDAAAEAGALAAIAARGSEPALAFGDDGDAFEGLDPLVNRFDLGDDPLAWYRRRLELSRELWLRVQARAPRPGDDPQRARRSLLAGFGHLRGLPEGVSKYIGGMHTARDLPGDAARAAFVPVDPQRQREALQFLTRELFAVDSFRFRPEFLASLGPDFSEAARGIPVSIPQAVLQLQAPALDRVLSPGTAQRVLELPLYLDAAQRRRAVSLHEVYASLQSAVWFELARGGEIDPMRRNLQREHLRRVHAVLTRTAPPLPADAASLQRLLAGELLADLQRAQARRGLSVETRAHLAESEATLAEALRASMLRN